MTHLANAKTIAEQAHAGQTDKTGKPYVEHCRQVAEAVESLDGKIVAYLHDVIEKGDGWTEERLVAAGFSPDIVAAVEALTRREGEEDAHFIRRAASNELARAVKRADLEDNLRQALAAGLPAARYGDGLALLTGIEAGDA